MGYDPDAPSLTCREAEVLYEQINQLEDALGEVLSYLEGDPQYANAKPGLMTTLEALLRKPTTPNYCAPEKDPA